LNPLDDHLVTRLETVGHFPHCADAFAHFYRPDADFVVLVDHGDLIVEVKIEAPEKLSEEQERIMKEFAAAGGMKY